MARKAQDLTGQKFGRLTVVSRAEKESPGRIRWNCACECGNTTEVLSSSLVSGNTKSCGCAQGLGRAKDLTGLIFGRWTVLNRAPSKKGVAAFICECSCGKKVEVRGFALRDGSSQSCGCLAIEIRRAAHLLPKGVAAGNRALSVMKANAKNRALEWAISDEFAFAYMKKACAYCGSQPTNRVSSTNGDFIYNGLDRIDNAIGYVEHNILPCCFKCNSGKNNMPLEAFIEWLSSVSRHLNLSRLGREKP